MRRMGLVLLSTVLGTLLARIVVGECYPDRAFGGRGEDVIDVYDGCVAIDPPTTEELRDLVDCGPGFDVVRHVGPEDEIADECERKIGSVF